MRLALAILLGKVIFWLSTHLGKGGGSAAPGLYALKIYPDLVRRLTAQIRANVIITGTNGKTTTARMLALFAKTSGLKVIRNHTGSNLERGIASALITHPRHGVDRQVGIWELDEAAFNTVAPKINPQIIVFLNVFRDQLDRYGEVDTVVKKWAETLKKIKKDTIILVNGDDDNTSKLSKFFKGKVKKFGVKDYKIIGESIEHKIEQEQLDYEAKDVKLRGLTGSSFTLQTTTYTLQPILPLPGIYHIYDFLAAFGVGIALKFDSRKMLSSLKNFSPAFGRMEKFTFKPQGFEAGGYIFLVKNPAGATQVFETIAPQLKKDDKLLFALNDNLADGTDVSWIWDVDFEIFQNPSRAQPRLWRAKPRDLSIYVSGTRAYDLANRLKYAGFHPETILIEPDLKQAFHKAGKDLQGRLFVLPTYTAMLELQSILAKSGIKKPYWQEV